MELEHKLRAVIRDVPDFPKPGILFKDITPLLKDVELRSEIVAHIANYFSTQSVDAVAGIEARGFIFGNTIADHLSVPFLPIRKSGKLPYKTVSESYELEYGKASIEMHEDAIQPGWRVLVHDDLLATGGTAAGAARLINKLGGQVAGFSFIINLSFLPGFKNLEEEFQLKPHTLVDY